ncbi:MAG TPA: hypothetical protein PKY30_07015 [Myxococcota bacterium]|nr:hypothetical protein [Myxococcota bacterium]
MNLLWGLLLGVACMSTPPKNTPKTPGSESPAEETPPPDQNMVVVEGLQPMPYGYWGLNGFVNPEGLALIQQRIVLTTFQSATSDPDYAVRFLLPQVKAAGLKLSLRLTDDHEAYTTAEGDFDLSAWKNQLSRWKDSGIQQYIDDDVLIGHMLLDDITNFSGRDPDAADLEEMARYSKELMPGLMTFVRQQASHLPEPAGGRYVYVDAAVNQYEVMEGPVDLYGAGNAAASERLGLGIINGLNIADGGDGSSGQAGYRANHYAMSAEEILRFGHELLRVPNCGMFLNWEYDSKEQWHDGTIGTDYFTRPELQAALIDLGQTAQRIPRVPLLKSGSPP